MSNQNIHKAVDKGIAEVLYIKDLSLDNICEKILLMMSNPTYNEKIRKYSTAFRDRMETALERAIWWIEWTMRHPTGIVFEEKKLNFLQIESVDVISFLTITFGLFLAVVMLLIRKCFRIGIWLIRLINVSFGICF